MPLKKSNAALVAYAYLPQVGDPLFDPPQTCRLKSRVRADEAEREAQAERDSLRELCDTRGDTVPLDTVLRSPFAGSKRRAR